MIMIHTHSSEVEQQSPSHGTAWGAKLAARRGDQRAHDLESTPDASCQGYNIFPMGIRGISHQLAPDQLLFSFSCYDQPFPSDTAKDVWVCTPNLSTVEKFMQSEVASTCAAFATTSFSLIVTLLHLSFSMWRF